MRTKGSLFEWCIPAIPAAFVSILGLVPCTVRWSYHECIDRAERKRKRKREPFGPRHGNIAQISDESTDSAVYREVEEADACI